MKIGSYQPGDRDDRLHARSAGDTRARSFLWAVTFLLLSLVSAIFTVSGTTGEPGGLLGSAAIVGFLILAGVSFFAPRAPKNLR